jgi:Putative restriction endonuclease
MTQQLVNDSIYQDEIVNELDISHLVIEDDTPVDNIQSEKQQRLLVEPLYSSRALPSPFLAVANVGLFYQLKGEPIVPDAMISLRVQCAEDFSRKQDRSYFAWEFGKLPEVCVEIVSNQEGDELMVSRKSQQKGKTVSKQALYADIRIPYYVVYDPLRQIQGQTEMNGALLRVWSNSAGRYTELTPAEGINLAGQSVWLEELGLGVRLWEGAFEDEVTRLWLRWCDREGNVILTGAEGQEVQRQRAEAERQRAEAECQRAEVERQRAEAECQRAEAAELRAQQLAEQLRALGIDPE